MKRQTTLLLLFFLINCPIFAQSPADSTVIVVLGSSTAAGVGPSSPDSAWVNRYRVFHAERDSSIRVVNLAIGGFTSYNIMPDDFQPPPERPEPRSGHNITAALALNPRKIIINLPSNDAANNFSIAEQIANFDSLVAMAKHRGIPLWITTTQPRNFENPSQRENLMAMRDSILARYSHSGVQTIDFWNGIAEPEGRILPDFNSGDNVHLNDAAHRLFFRRVADAVVIGQ